MKDREKEINYLIYLKSKLIQDTKKEIKQLRLEKENLYKKGENKNGNNRN